MHSVRFFAVALLIMMLLTLPTGCTIPRTVQVQTMADPEMTFAEPGQTLVHIAIARLGDDSGDAYPRPIDRDQLRLSERHLLTEIERAGRDAGFYVVSRSEAEFIVYASTQTVTGERQTYRRVPVHETTHGQVHTRRGWRTFHGTTTSEVVVPEVRTYANRIITVTAHPMTPDGPPLPTEESSVWMGRLVGSANDLEDRIAPYIEVMFNHWGQTQRKTITVRPTES